MVVLKTTKYNIQNLCPDIRMGEGLKRVFLIVLFYLEV